MTASPDLSPAQSFGTVSKNARGTAHEPGWVWLRTGASKFFLLNRLLAVLAIFLVSSTQTPALAKDKDGGFVALEYFGSSLISRSEIEDVLDLKPGRPLSTVETSVKKLNRELDKRRLLSNVQTISLPDGRIFVVVDLEERGDVVPTTNLINPHHVMTKSEKPEILLESLKERLNRLQSEGRKYQESYPQGMRTFSDEPASQIIQEIRRFAPLMRSEWLEVVQSDPDPKRRKDAIELLNWAGNYAQTCEILLPALDDMSFIVRTATTRFIYPRLELLPDDFPFTKLAAALSRQIDRPSHEDRVLALQCIRRLLTLRPELTPPMMRATYKRVKELAEDSRIPTLKKAASEMLVVYSTYKPPAPRPDQIPESGF
ncbi:MAG: hypothetical protein K2Z81_00570 [Cyanobacteria bacterium]|nr:hypothetical protein [Cyanobacteriota bacterium]